MSRITRAGDSKSPLRGTHVLEYPVEGPRDALGLERVDEQHGIPLLAVPHEAVQLLLERTVPVCRLLLVRPECAQLALVRENALHSLRTERSRELVLQVTRAGEEPPALELRAV